MRRPSPAFVLAALALFVALGGPAEARKLINGKFIKKGTVRSKQIKDRSLTTRDLSKSAVAALLQTPGGSIGPAQLQDGAVTTSKLAAGAVTAGQLAANSVGGDKIADQSVGGIDLAVNSVSADELAGNSVDADEIRNGTLKAADVGSFTGELTVDFGSILDGDCLASGPQSVTAIRTSEPPPSVADDIVLLTPPASWNTAVLLQAAPSGPTQVVVSACNLSGGTVDPPSATFRYVTFDT